MADDSHHLEQLLESGAISEEEYRTLMERLSDEGPVSVESAPSIEPSGQEVSNEPREPTSQPSHVESESEASVSGQEDAETSSWFHRHKKEIAVFIGLTGLVILVSTLVPSEADKKAELTRATREFQAEMQPIYEKYRQALQPVMDKFRRRMDKKIRDSKKLKGEIQRILGKGSGAVFEHTCTFDGNRTVKCEFLNVGVAVGSTCVWVKIKKKTGPESSPQVRICSGLVAADDVRTRTKEVEGAAGLCTPPSWVDSWSDVCEVEARE
jgi:hypothetical protein